MKVRIMAQGEDGMEFCVENNVPAYRLDEAFEQAEENYPCAQLWTEDEDTHIWAAQQAYNDNW